LVLLDQIELEFDGNPGSKFKSNVLVGIGAAIPARLGYKADGVCLFNPLFRCQGETVKAGQFPKPVEFDGFKTRIIELLPYAEEFYGIAIPQPVSDQIIGLICVLVPCDVRDADVIGIV